TEYSELEDDANVLGAADTPTNPGDRGVDTPEQSPSGAPAAASPGVAKAKHSARLKKALQQSVVQAAAEAVIDPETGEILENEALRSPDEGANFDQVEPDTGPVAMVLKGKLGDVDKWIADVLARLDSFTTEQQVERFKNAVENSNPWTYVKFRSP